MGHRYHGYVSHNQPSGKLTVRHGKIHPFLSSVNHLFLWAISHGKQLVITGNSPGFTTTKSLLDEKDEIDDDIDSFNKEMADGLVEVGCGLEKARNLGNESSHG